MAEDAERRCPHCAALVAADANWCNQCYGSLPQEPASAEEVPDAPSRGPEPGSPGAVAVEAATAGAFWPCPVCTSKNPIDAGHCGTCGTSFAEIMRGGTEPVKVDAKDVLVWSLIFPGLGHRKAGRPVDGLARGMLFGVSFGMALIVAISGFGSAASIGVFLLFFVTAAAVYVLSLTEAPRLARGGDVLVPSRTLMWALVGVIFLSVGILGFAMVTSGRR